MTYSVQLVDEELLYPSSDGQPMAENTEQYQWIVLIAENIRALFNDNPDVFVAADLLWYAVKLENKLADEPIAQAPDVMVVLGRPQGYRSSYRQWNEANIPPQVVFEILSQSNKTPDGIEGMRRKFEFYQRHGVEEYYIYDPLAKELTGWQRRNDVFVEILNWSPWISPRLQIQFYWQPGQVLQICDPSGAEFQRLIDLKQQAEQERLRAEQERLQKEFEREQSQRLLKQARIQADRERQQKEQAQIQADRERQQKEQAQIQADRERLEKEQERQQKEQAQIQADRERQEKEQAQQQLEVLRARLIALGLDES